MGHSMVLHTSIPQPVTCAQAAVIYKIIAFGRAVQRITTASPPSFAEIACLSHLLSFYFVLIFEPLGCLLAIRHGCHREE